MKTIVNRDNNISLYLFSDDETVVITEENILVGDPLKFIVADCNSFNVVLIENVPNLENWIGCEYTYTLDNGWQPNA